MKWNGIIFTCLGKGGLGDDNKCQFGYRRATFRRVNPYSSIYIFA